MTGTGEEKVTSCQPRVDSLVNVAEARAVPAADHRVPMWVPVFATPL